METAGQILFVFGLVFTVNNIAQKVSVSFKGLRIRGEIGPVLMILGAFLWWIF